MCLCLTKYTAPYAPFDINLTTSKSCSLGLERDFFVLGVEVRQTEDRDDWFEDQLQSRSSSWSSAIGSLFNPNFWMMY